MSLAPDTKLGPYQILAPLGAGGMGEVYRARDTKLGRDVALKVLPDAFAGDAQRMARFEREAQVLASLNHPNIAAIYGLEESSGVRALVMELVEGETLAERIGLGAGAGTPVFAVGASPSDKGVPVKPSLQVDEAINIAQQIAEALEAAHEKGVIHRDLKPANIKITPHGTVKVLDFGLAKALDPQDSISSPAYSPNFSPTLSLAATQAGVILGTAAYMSPEQAKGKSVDRRADIWAFGCVLYEMLAGQKPFEGESVSDTLAAVIKDAPKFDSLPPTTPRAIRTLLSRCLVKDPRHRLQAIGEARIAIEEYVANPNAGEAVVPTASPAPAEPQPNTGSRILPLFVAAGLALVFGLAAGWWIWGRWIVGTPIWSGERLGGPTSAMGPRISADGHTLAFQAMVDGLTQVAVMDTESGDWTVLTKNRSRGYVTELNWSPDGSQIYFDREYSSPGGIYAVSRFGGDERLVLENAMGPEVLPDGSMLVTLINKERNFQLNRYWPESGRLEPLNAVFNSIDLCPPARAFRDGKEAVFFGKTLDQDKADPLAHLYAIDLASGKMRRLAPELNLNYASITFFPMAVAGNDQSVLVDLLDGDLNRIVSVPRNGAGPAKTLFSVTQPPWFMDVGKDGALYLDQTNRGLEVIRFPVQGGTPDVLASQEGSSTVQNSPFQTADGRVLLEAMIAGRPRLQLAKPGGDAVSFISTKEESSGPSCRLGEDKIAFLLGALGKRVLAVASIADGRIIRRFKNVPASDITHLAASRDGATLYYVADSTVWAVPTTDDGQPRRIGPGDAAAADPNGKDLIVQLREKDGVRLLRVPVLGGPEDPIPIQSPLRISPTNLGSESIGKDGRLLLSITTADGWFYGAGILALRGGKLERIPLNFTGDIISLGWQSDGRIIADGWPTVSKLWKFTPESPDGK
ncbi:MAG TPA: protein kinase [Terriglobia bacterium]|nr:protein kinase [Terriglobia bacterium]